MRMRAWWNILNSAPGERRCRHGGALHITRTWPEVVGKRHCNVWVRVEDAKCATAVLGEAGIGVGGWGGGDTEANSSRRRIIDALS